MPDMLCSLISIPDIHERLSKLRAEGITLRRANPWEATKVRDFIGKHFEQGWVDETNVCYARQPVSLFIALHEGKIIGFSAYEASRRGYFGPTGVDEAYRGRGVGVVLSLAALIGLRDMGYTYAVIGAAGPVEFYKRFLGAIELPFNNGDGIYKLTEDPAFTPSPRS